MAFAINTIALSAIPDAKYYADTGALEKMIPLGRTPTCRQDGGV